jgi:hypothetical protein
MVIPHYLRLKVVKLSQHKHYIVIEDNTVRLSPGYANKIIVSIFALCTSPQEKRYRY